MAPPGDAGGVAADAAQEADRSAVAKIARGDRSTAAPRRHDGFSGIYTAQNPITMRTGFVATAPIRADGFKKNACAASA